MEIQVISFSHEIELAYSFILLGNLDFRTK